MQFISKLTSSLFTSSIKTNNSSHPLTQREKKVELLLASIMTKNPKQFNLENCSEQLKQDFLENVGQPIINQFIIDNIDTFFNYISKEVPTKFMNDISSSYSIVQLISTVHKLFGNAQFQQYIALNLKEGRIQFIKNLQDIYEHQRIEDNVLNDSFQKEVQILFTETEIEKSKNKNSPQRFDPIFFAVQYHTFLQRMSANVDLYRSVSMNQFPYSTSTDSVDAKLMFLWLYKIQNLLNSAMPLLYIFEQNIFQIQYLILGDIIMFQNFLCSEISKIVEDYAILPNADSLSLYEIYKDQEEHSKIIESFIESGKKFIQNQKVIRPKISQIILQDFLTFSSRLRMLNQITFKKSIKVPNKANPCMGIPSINPNLRHLRSTSGVAHNNNNDIEQYIIEQKQLNSLKEVKEMMESRNIVEEEQKSEMLDSCSPICCEMDSEIKQKNKQNGKHIRGLSTFHK